MTNSRSNPANRVVITGAGVISPIAAGVADFERALHARSTAFAPSTLVGETLSPPPVTAEIRDFSPQQWLGNKGIRVLDRTARLLSVAAHLALCSGVSRADQGDCDPGLGLVCGTMFGSVHSITSFDWSGLVDGPNLVNPMDFPNTVINSAAGQAAIKFKLGGVNSTICAGLASGLHALHYASEFLRRGRARLLLAGGVEELSEEAVLGFRKNGLLSASGLPRPFSPDADGVVLGEGATLLILETAEDAAARGAAPWAEIAGFGAAHDARSIQAFSPDGEGAAAAMQMALHPAGVSPADVACIIASASGSPAADAMEARALASVFGAHLVRTPLCAPKSALGETLGLAGAHGALIGALALRSSCLPPTAAVPARPLEGVCISEQSQPIRGDYALVNAFSCDGNNASLLLRRWTPQS